MSGQKHEHSPAFKWEQALIDDYRDYRWKKALEPLCDKMQRWKEGEVSHEEMDQFMEQVHQQIWEMRNIFHQRRDRLVNLIQWWDREWFLKWVMEYTPPPGVTLLSGAPPPAGTSQS